MTFVAKSPGNHRQRQNGRTLHRQGHYYRRQQQNRQNTQFHKRTDSGHRYPDYRRRCGPGRTAPHQREGCRDPSGQFRTTDGFIKYFIKKKVLIDISHQYLSEPFSFTIRLIILYAYFESYNYLEKTISSSCFIPSVAGTPISLHTSGATFSCEI